MKSDRRNIGFDLLGMEEVGAVTLSVRRRNKPNNVFIAARKNQVNALALKAP
jgi:hypothetical protein